MLEKHGQDVGRKMKEFQAELIKVNTKAKGPVSSLIMMAARNEETPPKKKARGGKASA